MFMLRDKWVSLSIIVSERLTVNQGDYVEGKEGIVNELESTHHYCHGYTIDFYPGPYVLNSEQVGSVCGLEPWTLLTPNLD